MIITDKPVKTKHRGTALIMAMIFLVVCSALALSMAAMSGENIQVASNQHNATSALSAAQSGLECGKFLIKTLTLPASNKNVISLQEANKVWNMLCQQLQNTVFDGRIVTSPSRFCDVTGNGDQISTAHLNYGDVDTNFTLRFYRYDHDPNTIKFEAIGTCREAIRRVNMDLKITKDNKVLNYAIASRSRVWLTGGSTIHGDILSTWDIPEISPFNMTSDSAVYGTINTVLTLDQMKHQSYKLESLNSNYRPVDKNRAPLRSNYEDRYYNYNDEIKAYHEGINYEQSNNDLPGMDISDYDTEMFNSGLTTIDACPSSQREIEYFPHALSNYNYPRDGIPGKTWNRKLNRHVYKNQTFTNAKLPSNRNALFRNCTFEEILYIDCSKNAVNHYNNVRFENCTFNGIIVTNVPLSLEWQCNCLYFTGEATFENRSRIQEATILAPNFNVNLDNTNSIQGENNILTGVIIGGIVDVRGNAQINGTIISMCDTTQWSSGYATNIGATLKDGGSETTELGDTGVICIRPTQNQMLPSGITASIIIKNLQETYSER